jgi:cobaltochelatase CobS
MASATTSDDFKTQGPDIQVSIRQTFGIDSDMQVPAFSQPNEYVPDIDNAYLSPITGG